MKTPPPSLLKQLLRRTHLLLIIFLVAWLGPLLVRFPARYAARLDATAYYVAAIALALQIGVWMNVLVNYWCERYTARHSSNRAGATTIQALSVIIKIILWMLLVILTLENAFKQNVTALVAGLGVGGIAIAFALQNVLSDLFAAMSIITDKPFMIGDAIEVDTYSGKVEHVGLKSTRIRSDGGEQIVFGNSDLLKGRIRNFGRLAERQALLTTRVSGTATPDQLERIPGLIREVIEAIPNTRFIRSSLTAVTDSTFDFTTVYYVTNPAYQIYVDTQQALMLQLMRRLEQNGTKLGVQMEAAKKEEAGGIREPAPDAPPPPAPIPSPKT